MDPHDALAAVTRRRVLFGHQSVGADLLVGIDTLAADAGVLSPVHAGPLEDAPPGGALCHASVGANGRPEAKLDHFVRLVQQAWGDEGPEIVAVKFCYADIDAGTDVNDLWNSYRRAMDTVRRVRPDVTVMHVTVPLTVVQSGTKALVKRALGRRPYGQDDNARREAFNDLLRRAPVDRDPLFDLAAAEAVDHPPAGTVRALHRDYTNDGGHLNDAGRRGVAESFLRALAAA